VSECVCEEGRFEFPNLPKGFTLNLVWVIIVTGVGEKLIFVKLVSG
jgi:hypothetical protein